MKYQTATIGNFVKARQAHIQTGPFGTQLKASDYVEDGTPVINVRNIGYGSLIKDKLEFVDEDTKHRLSVHLLKKHDIVFGRKGAVDRHLYVSGAQINWMQGSDCIRLRFSSDKINTRYVSYAFLSETHRKWMLTQSGNKATMASLNQDIIKRISIYLPPLIIQNKIVKTISYYSDLIDTNLRWIQLLEDSARLLFHEWFVCFRFPGHEKVKIVDGVPEGWNKEKIFSIADVNYGKNLPTNKFTEGGEYPVYGAAKIIGKFNKYSKEKRAIIVGCRGSVGQVTITKPKSYITNNSFTFEPKNLEIFYWLYFSLYVRSFSDVISGTAQPQITLSSLSKIKLLFPNVKVIKDFELKVASYFNLIFTLEEQNQKLAQARDLLLPRLMSGKIDVSELDIRVAQEAET